MFKPITNKIFLGKATPSEDSGGGGQQPGTTDYNELLNKPSINDITLSGNKTLNELGIQAKGDYLIESDLDNIKESINSKADKANTLSGYGIEDTYTKIEVNSLLDEKVSIVSLGTMAYKNSFDYLTLQEIENIYAKKATTLEEYGINDAYTKSEIDTKIGSVYKVKGSVDTYNDLPTINRTIGDVWNVLDTGSNFVWDGNNWDKLSETIDLSEYYTKIETDNLLDDKVDKISGKTLSTNDFTDNYKIKLDSIEAGANINKIEVIEVNGEKQDITDKTISITIPDSYEKAETYTKIQVDSFLNNKADKSTTLSGYNIDDAYTKLEISGFLDSKVDKIIGKELSSNDYTTTEKTKLSDIEPKAQVNKLEAIRVNGMTLSIVNKTTDITIPDSYTKIETDNLLLAKQNTLIAGSNINISGSTISAIDTTYNNYKGATSSLPGVAGLVPAASSSNRYYFLRGDGYWAIPTNTTYTAGNNISISGSNNKIDCTLDVYSKEEIDAKIGSVYRVKGSVETYDNLPINNKEVGDVYNILDTGANYVWNGEEWDKLSETVDLTRFYTKTEINNFLDGKVDKVAGKNLSTNDYTTAEKNKLAGIASGAQANTITSIKVNGTTQTITNKIVDITVPDAYSKSEVDAKLSEKQNTLAAGTNISINGNVISAVDTKYSNFKGATLSIVGTSGLVPAPTSSDTNKFLRGNGTWDSISIPQYTSGDGIIIADNTISLSGEEFTASEKTKLSGIATGAQVNKIETIAVNGTNQTITNKRVNITVPTKTSQLTNDSGFITQATANGLYVSKTGYFPYSQEADKVLDKTSRWNINIKIEPLPVNTSLFYEPMNTNADGAVITDTLGRLIRISRIGHICFFEMDLRFIGNVNAGFRSVISEGFLDNYMPLNKYTRFPAQIYCENDLSYSQALEIYIEINKQDNCIYLYNNLVLNANVLRAPRIICNGSYISSSILES